MSRDVPKDDVAGLNTIDFIRKADPSVPIIVYAGFYSAQHENDELQRPVATKNSESYESLEFGHSPPYCR